MRKADDARAIEIKRLAAQLDEPGRRDFIRYTLRQRRPRLHRLFVTAARRADLARFPGLREGLADFAKQLKRAGHEDYELCKAAADLARAPIAWQDEEGVTQDAIDVLFASDVPGGEFNRATKGAAEAAALTAEDIGALRLPDTDPEAASKASANGLRVIMTAHLVDARASSKVGMAMSTTSALASLETSQNEQIKWLKNHLRATRKEEERQRPILGRIASLVSGKKIPAEKRDQLLAYIGWEARLAAFQDREAEKYNLILTKYGGAVRPGNVPPQVLAATRRLSKVADELITRHSETDELSDEAAQTYSAWQQTYFAYQDWVSAALAAYEGLSEGASPSVQRVEALFAEQDRAKDGALKHEVKLARKLGIHADELQRILSEAISKVAGDEWEPDPPDAARLSS